MSVFENLGVAITGASGVVYGFRFIEAILQENAVTSRIDVVISRGAKRVIMHEMGSDVDDVIHGILAKFPDSREKVRLYEEDDFSSPFASSSSAPQAMVVIPCSVKTLGEIVGGIASNVIVRGALSVLRLGRPLVLVPRETPLGVVELELMLRAARMGAHIVPAMPGFYHSPRSVEDLVDFVVGKVLDVLGVRHRLYRRWGGG